MGLGLGITGFGQMRAEVEVNRLSDQLDDARKQAEEAKSELEVSKREAVRLKKELEKLKAEVAARDNRIKQLERIATHCRRTHLASGPRGRGSTSLDPSDPTAAPPPPPKPPAPIVPPVVLAKLASTLTSLPVEIDDGVAGGLRIARSKVEVARRDVMEGIAKMTEIRKRLAVEDNLDGVVLRTTTPDLRESSPSSSPVRIPNPPPPTPASSSYDSSDKPPSLTPLPNIRTLEARLAENAARRAAAGVVTGVAQTNGGSSSLHRRRSSGWSDGRRGGGANDAAGMTLQAASAASKKANLETPPSPSTSIDGAADLSLGIKPSRSPSLRDVRDGPNASPRAVRIVTEPTTANGEKPLAKKWDKLLSKIERNKAKAAPSTTPGSPTSGGASPNIRRSRSLTAGEASAMMGKNVEGDGENLEPLERGETTGYLSNGKVVTLTGSVTKGEMGVHVQNGSKHADGMISSGQDHLDEAVAMSAEDDFGAKANGDFHDPMSAVEEASNDSAVEIAPEAERDVKIDIAVL
ncbi:hypothetical protein HDU93_010012 [Gonapodya sp. JEL0774]|nr:hypothetical protein HDU93_010012 [Gonapodya sp. JEL0774]